MVFNRYDKSEGHNSLRGLCHQFEKNIARYRQPSYDEADTRQDLIERLFLSFGWDVHNEQGASPQYKEVKFEGRVRIKEKGRETVKNPDLVFNMGPQPVFFVEIKPPHIKVPDAPSAFQLRRYAWSKHLPVSILTNFEDFCVYDTRYRPDINDNPKIALVKEINHKDYVKEFEYLWNTFSYEAVKGGSIEKFAEETRDKRGHMDVDDAFLKDIENFRYLLARNIELRNPPGKPFPDQSVPYQAVRTGRTGGASRLNIYELNDMVQKVIDRIIFLRICEDREIEEYGNLKDIVDEGSDIYERLMVYFGRAENRYNAGLFNLREDIKHLKSSPTIVIDDRVLSEIINSLYYPKSPYIFSEIPVEILGQVYERFLGKTIRLTPSGQAKIEYKPEVRKAGGIYYTPKYIVDYIVENTVGRLLEGKKPSQVKKIRILDPACGSGSFLLGAYGYLLRWYLERYIEDKDKYLGKTIYKTSKGGDDEFHLMIDERKRILMEHIYGVDIDPQAVEVTKLSLHLKVLEGETGETLDGQLDFMIEQALPNIDKNIRCGNSLIGPDFYKQFDIGLFDDDEIRRINVFDWNDDNNGFGAIMREGGFDAVIGNPPYVRIHGIKDHEKNYYLNNYETPLGQFDLYQLFYEVGLKLLKKKGLLGLITSNKFAITNYGKVLRKYITNNYQILKIVDFSMGGVFSDASTYPFIMIIENYKPKIDNKISLEKGEKGNIVELNREIQNIICPYNGNPFNIYYDELIDKIFKKGENILEVKRGQPTSKSLSDEPLWSESIIGISNKEIERYFMNLKSQYLNKESSILANNNEIVMKKICYFINASIPSKQVGVVNTAYIISESMHNIKYILGILNSKLISYFVRNKYKTTSMRGGYIEMRVFEVKQLPIRTIDFNNPEDVKMHDEVVSLVERMMILKKRYNDITEEQLRTQLDHAIKATDEQIDQLVYKLYNLTDEEIRVVEGVL